MSESRNLYVVRAKETSEMKFEVSLLTRTGIVSECRGLATLNERQLMVTPGLAILHTGILCVGLMWPINSRLRQKYLFVLISIHSD